MGNPTRSRRDIRENSRLPFFGDNFGPKNYIRMTAPKIVLPDLGKTWCMQTALKTLGDDQYQFHCSIRHLSTGMTREFRFENFTSCISRICAQHGKPAAPFDYSVFFFPRSYRRFFFFLLFFFSGSLYWSHISDRNKKSKGGGRLSNTVVGW